MLLIIVVLLAVTVPLAILPEVRCEVFGSGCAGNGKRSPSEGPAASHHWPPPVQVATRGGYVALGDSYSSGEGAYVAVADHAAVDRCHRTSQSYVHEVMRAFRFARGTAFWACSGATASSVMTGGSGEPPQVDRVGSTTSLVTISIGGNDIGFSQVLTACAGGPVANRQGDRHCQDQDDEIATRLRALRPSLTRVIDRITARAPYARIIVLGYPRLFSGTLESGYGTINIADQRWLNARTHDLDELIRQVTNDADKRIVAEHASGSVEFVDTYNAFAGHETGSTDPYVHGLDLDLQAMRIQAQSFHPTASGYTKLAELVIRQIDTGPTRPLNPQ